MRRRCVPEPLRGADEPRLHQVQPVEEPLDLRPGAGPQGDAAGLIGAGDLLRLFGVQEVGGAVRDDQETARRQGVDEGPGDSVGIVVVPEEVQDRDERQRDGPVEVQETAGVFEDLCRSWRTSVST